MENGGWVCEARWVFFLMFSKTFSSGKVFAMVGLYGDSFQESVGVASRIVFGHCGGDGAVAVWREI